TSLPGGTALPPDEYGPAVSASYPLGYYVEDYEYVAGLGDLDDANGRTVVTPEYPSGTYAYVATIDSTGASAYPYALGPIYHGVVAADTSSPNGHVSIPSPVTTYPAGTNGVMDLGPGGGVFPAVPNPFHRSTTIAWEPPRAAHVVVTIHDLAG